MPEPTDRGRPIPHAYFLPEEDGPGLLDWAAVEPRLSAARNYWLVTASAAAVPHAMPVWGVWLDGRFLFSTGVTTRKARNIRENPRVSLHLEDAAAVLALEGVAAAVPPDSPDIARFLDAYNPKYHWDFTAEAVSDGSLFAITMTRAFGWLGDEGEDFLGTGTRWRFDPGPGAR